VTTAVYHRFGPWGSSISADFEASWVAPEDPRPKHERDAAQAGLNEAAGRELRRLWGLRAPQTCAIRDQLGWVSGQIGTQPGRRDRLGVQ
jgi:hypothetical protein